MEEKKSKYNYGEHIPLSDIPIEECEMALHEFADGSFALEKCLRAMWINGLRTYSCHHGENSITDIGHIVMEEGVDVFVYLSEELLNDEGIRIDIVDNKQEIKFTGTAPEKEGAILFITREIIRGKKKHNCNLVQANIGKPFSNSWVRRFQTYDSNVNSTFWGGRVFIKKK